MKTRHLLAATALLLSTGASAQEKAPTWINHVKLSGYGMVQYQASDKTDAKANSFNLRLARISLDGRILNDFYWKAQIQFNGNTSQLGSSPRVVDLFAEWQKYTYFRVKAGQFKRPFTFENPMHPIEQGFMGYSQIINNIAGFTDRAGGHSSNGRDIGVQVQGDLLPNASGRNLLHYQVGVFNGQGINVSDVDQQKDLIGGLWLMPVKGMRIGAFGWTGSYARKYSWKDEANVTHNEIRRLPQRRYAFSADYVVNDWTFRTEYAHSTGLAFKNRYQKPSDANDITLNNYGDKAQGVYALAIAPIIKNRLHAKARYDMYQPSGDASKQKTQYELGLDYVFSYNLKLSGEYALVNDRSINNPDKHNYNLVDVQLSFRF